ncbi:MAG: META domain-containing protein [Sphingobacteriaceae bacterium]|nr:META domain-containing protein [Sphingobacteriaceae bacterium]
MKNALRITMVVVMCTLLSACFPDRKEIRDNTWIAVSLKASDNDSTWNPGAAYELTFPEKRGFSIQLDVNTCGGKVVFNPNNIIFFNDIFCTEACCDSPFATELLRLLAKVNRYQFNENQMVLTGNNGITISFVRK